jgi:hypothetical protein
LGVSWCGLRLLERFTVVLCAARVLSLLLSLLLLLLLLLLSSAECCCRRLTSLFCRRDGRLFMPRCAYTHSFASVLHRVHPAFSPEHRIFFSRQLWQACWTSGRAVAGSAICVVRTSFSGLESKRHVPNMVATTDYSATGKGSPGGRHAVPTSYPGLYLARCGPKLELSWGRTYKVQPRRVVILDSCCPTAVGPLAHRATPGGRKRAPQALGDGMGLGG